MNWVWSAGFCMAALANFACSGKAAPANGSAVDPELGSSDGMDAGASAPSPSCSVKDPASCPRGQHCAAPAGTRTAVCAPDEDSDAGTASVVPGDAGPSACGELGCELTTTPPLSTTPPPNTGASNPNVNIGDGACLACAHSQCATQYEAAIGTDSSPENLTDVSQLLSCVIGPDWQSGNAIPTASCFFADPAQPLGSLVPCYCGDTPTASCVTDGPTQPTAGCTPAVETASHCSPASASCVTASGADPSTPLGDVFQLLNCERALCPSECGFPQAPVDE